MCLGYTLDYSPQIRCDYFTCTKDTLITSFYFKGQHAHIACTYTYLLTAFFFLEELDMHVCVTFALNGNTTYWFR